MKTLAAIVLFLASASPAFATTTVVISGLGGSEEYDEQFASYATTIADEARLLASSPHDVIMVRGDAAKRSVILGLFSNLAVKNNTESLTVYLIGHGSFDGQTYKFNIPGTDITGPELTDALNGINAKRQLIVVATSASGAMLEPLADPARVVITATKNGRERNAVHFPKYMVDALSDPAADINKNEIISAQEMFAYAEREVSSYYEGEKLLAAEHPRIEGSLAEEIEVGRYGTLLRRKDSISPELLTQREQLSAEINNLRTRKEDISEDEYFDRLQTLMLDLATIQRTIDDAGSDENAN